MCKHNLQVPKSFDELYTVLKTLQQAYPDSTPFTTRAIHECLDAIAYAFGTGFKLYFDHSIDKGTYKYDNITPEFKTMLEYLHKLYAYEVVNGKPQFLKSFLEKLKVNDATGINTLYSELGSGYYAYSPLVDRFGPELEVMDEATKQLYKQYAEDPAVKNTQRQINVTPPLTKDQQDQVKQIQTNSIPSSWIRSSSSSWASSRCRSLRVIKQS